MGTAQLAITAMKLFDQKDYDGCYSHFAEDVKVVTPLATCNNLDDWKVLTQNIARAFPDVRHEIGRHFDSGDTGVVEFKLVGTHKGPLATAQGEVPPTGRSINTRSVRIERAEGGRIVEGSMYLDQIELMTQLGLMPAPVSA